MLILNAMTDDPAATMVACRCQSVDGALKAIENVVLACETYFERLVVFISTNFTG